LGAAGPSGSVGTFPADVRAVVVIVRVVLAPGVTEGGVNVAAAPVGNPDVEKVTGVGKVPATADVVIVYVAVPPALTVCGPDVLVTLKSVTLNDAPFDVPPPGVGLKTVTVVVPPVATSDAETAAVNCVALTNVVVSEVVFHLTTEALTKLVPLTVSVNAAPPVIAEVGESVVMVGTGWSTVSVTGEVDDGANPLVLV
jgi:hypothetical protein